MTPRLQSPAAVALASEPLLSVEGLRVHFQTQRGIGKAVDGVNFKIARAETLGLVGESGSGKSLTALAIVGLHPQPASRVVGGRVIFGGEDLLAKSAKELRRYRGRHISMILQDPMTALNPVFTIGEQLFEPLRVHQGLHGAALWKQALETLRLLRIPGAERRLQNYPHQFSGGMRQRVVSAIALSCNPGLLIADEPTTSLDVTVQAAFLRLLKEVQKKTSLAVLFITHDFATVGKMCDRVAVMYAGRIVEVGPTWQVIDRPAHPYTEALLNSVPDVLKSGGRLIQIEGQPPSIYAVPPGCPFAPRCPYVMPRCRDEYPPERELAPAHTVSCWRHV